MDTKLTPIPQPQDDTSVMLASATDIKHWEVVQMVIQALRDGAQNTVQACKDAGVDRSLYYRALKTPYVQQQRAEQVMATIYITQEMIEKNWFPVMANMVKIATHDDGRDGVAAARFIKDVYDDVRGQVEQGEAGQGQEEPSFLKKFASSGGKGKYRARRKRGELVEEIEVELSAETD